MNTKSNILKNASWIIVCKIIQAVISFFIGMYTARYLGPANYGLINYAASVTAFLIPVMQLGFRSILVNEFILSPKREGEILGTTVVLSVCSAFLSIIGIFAFTMIANRGERDTIIVCLLYSVSLLFQAVELTEMWFQAKLLSKYTSLATLIAYFFVSAVRIYLLISDKSIFWFAGAYVLDYFLIAFILLIFYRKNRGLKLSFSFNLGKELLGRSKFYIVSTMMVTIFAQTDRIMLKLMIDETQTGYYSTAITCISAANFVYAAIIDSFRPSILDAKKNNSPDFEKRLATLYAIITYLSLAQSIAMTILAKPIILIIYGEAYAPSIDVLRVAVWYVTFSYYGMVRNIWILAEQKQKYLWIINLTGAVANVILNYLLIPIMGVVGAGLASLLTQFFTNVIVNYFIKPIRYNNRIMLRGLNPKLLLNLVTERKDSRETL